MTPGTFKWTNELRQRLKLLVEQGHTDDEIKVILDLPQSVGRHCLHNATKNYVGKEALRKRQALLEARKHQDAAVVLSEPREGQQPLRAFHPDAWRWIWGGNVPAWAQSPLGGARA